MTLISGDVEAPRRLHRLLINLVEPSRARVNQLTGRPRQRSHILGINFPEGNPCQGLSTITE
jgi:hypothetical protein